MQKAHTTPGWLSPREALISGTSWPRLLYSTATPNSPSSTPGRAAEYRSYPLCTLGEWAAIAGVRKPMSIPTASISAALPMVMPWTSPFPGYRSSISLAKGHRAVANMARFTYLGKGSFRARAWSMTPRKKGHILRKLMPQKENPVVRK